MRCPRLAELPSPPAGKTGWPWTVETPQLPAARPDGTPWPRISIVTPSYNQGQFIEETIRSVLLQGYPDLEYIVIDGGSTDGAIDIIRKYAPWLAYWTSERDDGQVGAINAGMSQASGSLLNWINSDDLLLPRALEALGSIMAFTHSAALISGGRHLSVRPEES
jgi:glycosyltransferase involved in cell wall biosynthesis